MWNTKGCGRTEEGTEGKVGIVGWYQEEKKSILQTMSLYFTQIHFDKPQIIIHIWAVRTHVDGNCICMSFTSMRKINHGSFKMSKLQGVTECKYI